MSMTIDLTQLHDFNRIMQLAPEAADKEFLVSTNVALMETVSLAQENVPVRDGILKNDIRVMQPAEKVGNAYTGQVGTDLEYSAQREFGGVIRARNAKFLRFEIDGRVYFKKEVYQTGSHYMQKAEEAMEPRLVGIYDLAITRAFVGLWS